MNHDLYSYSIQMQRFLEAQDKRIMKLEHELKRLTDELGELKKNRQSTLIKLNINLIN